MFKKRFFINLEPVNLPGTRSHWHFRSLEEHRIIYRELFCDCKFCFTMKIENMPKCENQDVVGIPNEWKMHISRQLKNPAFEDDASEESDQFDPTDAVKLKKRKRRPSNLKSKIK